MKIPFLGSKIIAQENVNIFGSKFAFQRDVALFTVKSWMPESMRVFFIIKKHKSMIEPFQRKNLGFLAKC